MQNDMLSYYLSQVKRVVWSDGYIAFLFESFRATPVSEMRLRMHLVLDAEVHMLAVLVQAPDALCRDVSHSLAADRNSPVRVRQPDDARNRVGRLSLNHVLDGALNGRPNCLLQERTEAVLAPDWTAGKRFVREHTIRKGTSRFAHGANSDGHEWMCL